MNAAWICTIQTLLNSFYCELYSLFLLPVFRLNSYFRARQTVWQPFISSADSLSDVHARPCESVTKRSREEADAVEEWNGTAGCAWHRQEVKDINLKELSENPPPASSLTMLPLLFSTRRCLTSVQTSTLKTHSHNKLTQQTENLFLSWFITIYK